MIETRRRIHLGQQRDDVDPLGENVDIVQVLDDPYQLEGEPEVLEIDNFEDTSAQIVDVWWLIEGEGWMDH